MRRNHCDFCNAVISELEGNEDIKGEIRLARRLRPKSVHTDKYGNGAWCSLEHLIAWLQREFNGGG